MSILVVVKKKSDMTENAEIEQNGNKVDRKILTDGSENAMIYTV